MKGPFKNKTEFENFMLREFDKHGVQKPGTYTYAQLKAVSPELPDEVLRRQAIDIEDTR